MRWIKRLFHYCRNRFRYSALQNPRVLLSASIVANQNQLSINSAENATGKRTILIPSRRQNAPRANSRYAIRSDLSSGDTIPFEVY